MIGNDSLDWALRRRLYFQLVLGFALQKKKLFCYGFKLKPPPKTPAEDKLSKREKVYKV